MDVTLGGSGGPGVNRTLVDGFAIRVGSKDAQDEQHGSCAASGGDQSGLRRNEADEDAADADAREALHVATTVATDAAAARREHDWMRERIASAWRRVDGAVKGEKPVGGAS